jgi:hypothetical protein
MMGYEQTMHNKMSILIVPYEGESTELSKALNYKCSNGELSRVLKGYDVSVSKKCDGGSCPIPKPFRMLTASEIKDSISTVLKNGYIRVAVLALNEKDLVSLSEMNRSGSWGIVGKNVTINIIRA